MNSFFYLQDMLRLDALVEDMRVSPKQEILVVDDNPDSLLLAQRALHRTDFELITARSVEAALEYLKSSTPHILVTDLMFPEKSGFSLLERLREIPRLSAVPALVMSGRQEDEFVNRARALGAMDYLVKPFSPQKLLERVLTYL